VSPGRGILVVAPVRGLGDLDLSPGDDLRANPAQQSGADDPEEADADHQQAGVAQAPLAGLAQEEDLGSPERGALVELAGGLLTRQGGIDLGGVMGGLPAEEEPAEDHPESEEGHCVMELESVGS
jgi:hypothetical protein